MKNPISCSIVIPCYNEAVSIPLLLKRCKEINSLNNSIEVILVNNGSTDNTKEIFNELVGDFSFIKRVNIEKNKGYGYGILAGLEVAKGEIIGWTHADLQTDMMDVLNGLKLFNQSAKLESVFVKGRRYGRPFFDVFFTICMSIFEIVFLRKIMWDINAQPTLFHNKFFQSWEDPPHDFSLDLYAYYKAKESKKNVKRFPVLFDKRLHGESHWNRGIISKYNFIKRAIKFSASLKNKIK